MKICLITDTHFGTRKGSQIFAEYFNRFYYEQFFPYLKEHGISTILHLGDIVDERKSMGYSSSKHLRRFMKYCNENDIEFHGIIGNHDCPYKTNNNDNSMQELYSHSKYEPKWYQDPTEIEFDGTKMLILPWICKDNYDDSMSLIEKTKAQIVFGHLEIQGFDMYKGSKSHGGLKQSTFSKFDLVCSGHYHHKSSKGNINYLGAPYEMTWSDWNDPRGFHIFDTDTRELTFIQNKYHIFHKIYYVEDEMDSTDFDEYTDCYVKVIAEEKKNQRKFDEWYINLQNANPYDLQVIEDSSIDSDDIDENIDVEDTKVLLRNSVDNLETNVDKQKLMILLEELHNEAMNQE